VKHIKVEREKLWVRAFEERQFARANIKASTMLKGGNKQGFPPTITRKSRRIE